MKRNQLSLFDHIAFAYADREELDNAKLYREVSHLADIPQEVLNTLESVGASGKPHKTNLRTYIVTGKQIGRAHV